MLPVFTGEGSLTEKTPLLSQIRSEFISMDVPSRITLLTCAFAHILSFEFAKAYFPYGTSTKNRNFPPSISDHPEGIVSATTIKEISAFFVFFAVTRPLYYAMTFLIFGPITSFITGGEVK